MQRAHMVGLVLTVVGLIGYAVGLWQAYPGRAFSLTLVMVGITLFAVTESVDRTGAES